MQLTAHYFQGCLKEAAVIEKGHFEGGAIFYTLCLTLPNYFVVILIGYYSEIENLLLFDLLLEDILVFWVL